ncbi:MAG: hypothetical protein AB1585_11330 [Thermodesulfobacteriota bacterium]
MDLINTLLKHIIDAAPLHPGWRPPYPYLLMNLFLPVLLGLILAWLTRLIEKGLISLLGEKH